MTFNRGKGCVVGRVYGDYQRDRVGWFLGLTGVQLGTLAAGLLPVTWAVNQGRWGLAAGGVFGWVVLVVIVTVPVRGRSLSGWFTASLLFTVSGLTGRTRFASQAMSGAVTGRMIDSNQPDLPAPVGDVAVHTSARATGAGSRVAVVEHGTTRTWSVTARLEHPGMDWLTGEDRDRRGTGLAALLDAACQSGLMSELVFQVRVSPDHGADRDRWVCANRDLGAASLSQKVHDDLRRHLTLAAVSTETYLTVVIPDRRLQPRQRSHAWTRGEMRDQPRGNGHAAKISKAEVRLAEKVEALLAVASELGEVARVQLHADRMTWLGSAELAEACRVGFHPDTAAVLFDARDTTGPRSNEELSGVRWAVAGPAHSRPEAGHYVHDRWRSSSTSVVLPARGAPLGALAPVLMSGEAGERRCLMVGFPVMSPTVADKVTASREWAADLGDGLRSRAGVRPRARTRADTATARSVDAKLVNGASLCRPYAIATTTVPAEQSILDAARRLDASVRRAGFSAQRMDLSHDTGFVAGCLPLGHTLTSPVGRS